MDYVEYGVESSRKISSHFDFDFGLEIGIGIVIEQEVYGSDVGEMVPQTHHSIDLRASREQPWIVGLLPLIYVGT